MSLWPVTTANSYMVGYLLLTVVAPALAFLWWYREPILRPFLPYVDALGRLGIRLYAKIRSYPR